MNTVTQTLRAWAVQDVVTDPRARRAFALVAFVLATAFGAQVAVRFPWTQVPMTLQPLFVILAGAALGPRLGALAIASYVTIGAAGAPVFSNGAAGLPWLLGPTGGYLLAMPAAAYVVGAISGRDAGAGRMLLGLTLGIATIYAGGVSWLLMLTGGGLATALSLGVLPFVAGDVTKILLAFFATKTLRGTSFGRL
ncbi:MAG: biotin transporter BioY [Gemmatimonadota bacterium]|nr:biotin transporter BioY [Gemmatimonadota bacterium]